MLILDLCGGTGSWSLPYARAGYKVVIIDPLRNMTVEEFLSRLQDFGWLNILDETNESEVHGVLAAPPCTEFSSAGARHWNIKDPALLDAAIETVRACVEVVKIVKPKWWALENPTGRIATCCPFLGEKRGSFHPWEYGDQWIKLTHLWGEFVMPPKTVLTKPSSVYDRTHRMSEASGRAALRSMTSAFFAEAFFRSNP